LLAPLLGLRGCQRVEETKVFNRLLKLLQTLRFSKVNCRTVRLAEVSDLLALDLESIYLQLLLSPLLASSKFLRVEGLEENLGLNKRWAPMDRVVESTLSL